MTNPKVITHRHTELSPAASQRGISLAVLEVLASQAIVAGTAWTTFADSVPAVPVGVTLDSGATIYDYWARRRLQINKTVGGACVLTIAGTGGPDGPITVNMATGVVTAYVTQFDEITSITSDVNVTIDIQADSVVCPGARGIRYGAGGAATVRLDQDRFTRPDTTHAANTLRPGLISEITACTDASAMLEY